MTIEYKKYICMYVVVVVYAYIYSTIVVVWEKSFPPMVTRCI